IYIVMILAFTGAILVLVRFRRQNIAKYVVMGSIFVTLAFVLLLPLAYGLDFVTGSRLSNDALGYAATVLSFAIAAALVYLLVKFPEWYVVDAVGITTAAGVTAILGISFGLLPAILLLVALAIYDAWAVYRTKHMITLADELTSQRLPILLVIPKKSGYSFREQKSLKAQVASGEEREAMFVGLGDLIIPGILAVSSFTYATQPGNAILGLAPNALLALGCVLGCLVGFMVLMRYVLKGNPQAGLPLLNGGTILGFVVASLLAYGTVRIF
ncbi:MAG TPA: presenilin family intramembrane aspartyl protease PSH, partial [Thermoplasmata archaeon]|nr:presenilin family intramembrane aspartyl protease PSH [Thermoplasmata archaeon]